MTILEYEAGQQLALKAIEIRRETGANEFFSLLQATMRTADSWDMSHLKQLFPDVWKEMEYRYNAPGGKLPSDP